MSSHLDLDSTETAQVQPEVNGAVAAVRIAVSAEILDLLRWNLETSRDRVDHRVLLVQGHFRLEPDASNVLDRRERGVVISLQLLSQRVDRLRTRGDVGAKGSEQRLPIQGACLSLHECRQVVEPEHDLVICGQVFGRLSSVADVFT
nr:hypothetical protein [Rathayibacter iranicus]